MVEEAIEIQWTDPVRRGRRGTGQSLEPEPEPELGDSGGDGVRSLAGFSTLPGAAAPTTTVLPA